MNIYVETNFVLELILLQEQFQSCEKILEICKKKKANLIIPSFSLPESLEKIHRQKTKRENLEKELNAEINQLSRTFGYKKEIQRINDINLIFTKSIEEERVRFEKYKKLILNIATILPLNAKILTDAVKHQSDFDLSPKDSIIFESILIHLNKNSSIQSCFLNRDKKDFLIPQIITKFQNLNCKLVPSFRDGYNFINATKE